jgi:hypothetical protein
MVDCLAIIEPVVFAHLSASGAAVTDDTREQYITYGKRATDKMSR